MEVIILFFTLIPGGTYGSHVYDHDTIMEQISISNPLAGYYMDLFRTSTPTVDTNYLLADAAIQMDLPFIANLSKEEISQATIETQKIMPIFKDSVTDLEIAEDVAEVTISWLEFLIKNWHLIAIALLVLTILTLFCCFMITCVRLSNLRRECGNIV